MLKKSRNKPEEPVKREPFTYIHRGTTLEGRLEAVGRVRVHGLVKGDVVVDGTVEVAPAGAIVGALVRAEELRVLGRVEADVVVSGKVEIWNGGELIGDVTASALDIEEGARFTGHSRMAGPDGDRALLAGAEPAVGERPAEGREDPHPSGAGELEASAPESAVASGTAD